MDCDHSSEFLFVTYTEQPEKASKRTLRAVRKHVMDDYFRRQKGKDAKKHHTTAGVDRMLQAKGGSGRSSTASSIHSTEPCSQQYSPPNLPESYTSCPSEVIDRQWYASHESSPLSLSLSPQRVDPFDVLPLSGTIDQDELIRWISYRDDTMNWELAVPWLYIYDSIYSKALWNASMDNRGLFHIMLSIGQSRRAIVRKQHDISTSLYHHGQALQCLRQRMAGT
ncbi:hypothetical protein BDV97DRAFT_222680 [Delphinella strobiligena]|nr:hypothetical protein BDV97DRAFT_222680 [Delphinella strobiligena]